MLFCITTPPNGVLIQRTKGYVVISLKQHPEGGYLQHFLLFRYTVVALGTFIIAKDLGVTPGNRHNFLIKLGETFSAAESNKRALLRPYLTQIFLLEASANPNPLP